MHCTHNMTCPCQGALHVVRPTMTSAMHACPHARSQMQRIGMRHITCMLHVSDTYATHCLNTTGKPCAPGGRARCRATPGAQARPAATGRHRRGAPAHAQRRMRKCHTQVTWKEVRPCAAVLTERALPSYPPGVRCACVRRCPLSVRCQATRLASPTLFDFARQAESTAQLCISTPTEYT